ncbi:hypothetical protein LIER_40191 [Lithospermum erythrorhizon]|uniref:DELLA protein n=1 Tax=Lithospermum erythrorhizon TaxID=34254 RepID=A0AAV3QQY0_LITER
MNRKSHFNHTTFTSGNNSNSMEASSVTGASKLTNMTNIWDKTGNGAAKVANIWDKTQNEAGKVTNIWDKGENEAGGGLDELMEVLGYKVKASDMTEVAQKLEQLEEAMGSCQQDGLLSQLGSETVHYNPSDLSTWINSMISELNPCDNNQCFQDAFMADSSSRSNLGSRSYSSSSVVIFDDSAFDSDLTAIPGKAIYPPPPPPPPPPPSQTVVGLGGGGESSLNPPSKRLKPNRALLDEGSSGSNNSYSVNSVNSIRPVMMVESEENGVRLVHALMACAEAVQSENYKLAEVLVKKIGILAVSQAGSMRKVATYFAEALARRIYKLYPSNQNDLAFNDYLQMYFYEACPYLKFAHFTANQAILEAFAGKSHVHIIDFGIKQGMQWPALLQALALRSGGPPSFRLTGIGPPSSDNTDYLQEVGWKLAQLADTIDIKFEYRGYVASSLADLDASMFDVREGETVAVNSIFELHQMLARPGAIDKVLSVVKGLKPSIFTVVEQEANHNGPQFLDRFTESLHYYSTLFDSVEGGGGAPGDCDVGVVGGGGGVAVQDKVMTEVYLGRQICNVVACEGIDRVERHETLAQWRTRFDSSELEPVHLGSNAFKQASMLLALFSGDGYRVEENNGCLLLGWHTRPLISTSAWKLK